MTTFRRYVIIALLIAFAVVAIIPATPAHAGDGADMTCFAHIGQEDVVGPDGYHAIFAQLLGHDYQITIVQFTDNPSGTLITCMSVNGHYIGTSDGVAEMTFE